MEKPLVSQPDDEEIKKPFRIERRRLGSIKFVREDGEFGFIEAEDYREDVFFHRRDWLGGDLRQPVEPVVDMWVEFELDDEHFATEKKLRAKSVRPTSRPEGRKMSARDATFQIVNHHPNARKKRPSWKD